MPTYAQILANAWRICWRNPWLWVLGIFGALVTNLLSIGVNGLVNSVSATGIYSLSLADYWFVGTSQPLEFLSVQLVVLGIVAVLVVLVWVTALTQASLVYETIRAGANQQTPWRQLLAIGRRKAWKLVGLYFFLMAFYWGVLTPFLFFNTHGNPIIITLLIVMSVLALPVMIVPFLMLKYAIAAVVLDNQNVRGAIRQSTSLFFDNWLLSLEVGLLIFAIAWLVSSFVQFITSLTLVALLQAFPFGIVLRTASFLADLLTFVTSILLIVFVWAVWTTIYELLTSPKVKLQSWVARVFGKKT